MSLGCKMPAAVKSHNIADFRCCDQSCGTFRSDGGDKQLYETVFFLPHPISALVTSILVKSNILKN